MNSPHQFESHPLNPAERTKKSPRVMTRGEIGRPFAIQIDAARPAGRDFARQRGLAGLARTRQHYAGIGRQRIFNACRNAPKPGRVRLFDC